MHLQECFKKCMYHLLEIHQNWEATTGNGKVIHMLTLVKQKVNEIFEIVKFNVCKSIIILLHIHNNLLGIFKFYLQFSFSAGKCITTVTALVCFWTLFDLDLEQGQPEDLGQNLYLAGQYSNKNDYYISSILGKF